MNNRTVTGIFTIVFLLLFPSTALAAQTQQATELELSIRIETNPVTGQSFSGVAADGISCIGIEVSIDGVADGKLKYTKPLLGSIEAETDRFGKVIELKDGKAQVAYRPPTYVEDSKLLEKSENPDVWKATDSFSFIYNDNDGNRVEHELNVDICRPPVVLVHGFTGEADTWEKLDSCLSARKFDTLREEYYSANQSIYDQTRALHEHIRNRMDSYAQNNIKLNRVDLIAHSVGGLIGRYYVNNAGYYEENVRKLIMVATPNHGCDWNDLQTMKIQPWLESHYRAARQMYRDSSYLTELNSGEASGMHLNQEVEYGLIYSYSDDPGFFGGDAVVSASSSYLKGVTAYKVQGRTHEQALSDTGPPIAEDEQVFEQIEWWLEKKIKRPIPKSIDIRVIKVQGEAYIRAWSEDGGNDKRLDAAETDSGKTMLMPWNSIWTDEGRAMVEITVNGIWWGHIRLDRNTNILIGYVSPEIIEVRMLQGSVRYTSYRLGGGHFSVDLLPENGGWHNITALDTDFAVEMNDTVSHVLPLKGKAGVKTGKPDNSISMMNIASDPVSIDQDGNITAVKASESFSRWWEDDFFKISSTAGWVKGILNYLFYQIKSIPRWSNTGKIAGAAVLLILMYLTSRRKRRFVILLILIGGTAAAAIYPGLPYIGNLPAKTVIAGAAVLTVLSFMGSLSAPGRRVRNWKRSSYRYRKNQYLDDYGYEDYDIDDDNDFDGDD